LEEHDHPLDGGLNKVLCQVRAVVCVVPSLDPDRCLFFWVCWRVAQRLSPPFFFFFLSFFSPSPSILPFFHHFQQIFRHRAPLHPFILLFIKSLRFLLL